MLTPQFEITQDDEHLYIKIFVSNVRFSSSNLDITINRHMVNFTLLPYYLRLKFNDNELLMSEEDLVKGSMIQEVTDGSIGSVEKNSLEQPFECSLTTEKDGSECVIVKLFKLEKGCVFQDLDNHLKLLARENENVGLTNHSMLKVVGEDNVNKSESAKPLIQEMDDNVNDIELISKLGGRFDWQIKQNPFTTANVKSEKKIGFSLKHEATTIIASIYNNNEINEVPEQNILKQESQDCFEKELIQLRNYRDNLKFDADYYMNDYITFKYGPTTEMMKEDLEINGILKILKYIPKDIKHFLQWVKLKQVNKPKFKDTLTYTSFEQEQMREKLPKHIKHDMSQFHNFVIPSDRQLFVEMKRSPTNLVFDKLDEKWQRNFVFIINVLFGFIFQEMEFDFDLQENENGSNNTKNSKSREQTSERTWLIGKLAPQLSNLDQTLLLAQGRLKDSCNWNPSMEQKDEDFEMEDDSNDFFIKEISDHNEATIEPPNTIKMPMTSENEQIKAALIIAVKKSLSYPLHRNLQLSLKVIDYLNYALIAGSKFIIKLLLKVHELFRYDDVYYIYNKIWFDDLLTWLLLFSDTGFHDLNSSVVNGDSVLDNIFRDMAVKISTINKGFKQEDFDFMIIQDELNEEGNNIEWDSLNIKEIENISDVNFSQFIKN